MDSSRVGFRRVATSWALIGVGTAGVIGATTLSYAETVKSTPNETAAYPAGLTPSINRPHRTRTTTTTSVAPSYSPSIHTRSRGS